MAEIQTPEFNNAMQELSVAFQNALQNALKKPYPYAPGFDRKRAPFGVSPKVATGNLANSISVTYNANSGEVEVSMLDYWRYVNDGRKPGKYVPLSSILQWIKQKGLKGRNKKTGRFITNESFAWGINTNIKKFGIAPTYFYDEAFKEIEPRFEDELIKALEIDITTFFERVVEQNV